MAGTLLQRRRGVLDEWLTLSGQCWSGFCQSFGWPEYLWWDVDVEAIPNTESSHAQGKQASERAVKAHGQDFAGRAVGLEIAATA